MKINVGEILVGKPLPTTELAHQSISKPVGLAVFASDALSSTAYATQEILIILAIAAGANWAAHGDILRLSLPIAVGIAVLLAIVTLSYRQTIYAYPGGGGAYIVARDNLGEVPAQIAGAALLTDYILTVAVSISSGVAQIVSAFPELGQFSVLIAVSVIIMMTVVNLRGVKESGRIFAVPTYFFIGSMFLMLGVGFFRYLTGDLSTVSLAAEAHHATESLTLFLILRAFSSGCTALTGIEAISNGITAFKEPKSKNAATTLMWMSGILITLFLGITFLANQMQVVPTEVPTVISQLAATIYGQNSILYLLTLVGTALILLMAANTSYADFPRLAALQAGDGFLPRQLTFRGSRLVFSWGIVVLALAASLLVIITRASVTTLIPLYAVGVFMSFTISQAGMVIRFNKIGKLKPGEVGHSLETALTYDPSWRQKQIVSAIGALCTFVVMTVFAVTKFTHGAWFIVLLIPMLVTLFFRIHHHYKVVARLLSKEHAEQVCKCPVETVVLIDNIHAETIHMINFARSLGHPWKAMHVAINPERTAATMEKWNRRIGVHLEPGEGELVILDSPFRQLIEPIRAYIEELRMKNPGCFVHIIMGHLVMDSFWEQALHQNSAYIFNLGLSHMDNIAVTQVPFCISREDEVAIEAEMRAQQEAVNLEAIKPHRDIEVAATSSD